MARPIEEEGSFDLISHVLLPKQVSPYRIDFPGVRMDAVKSVRMDARALLVPASADPVIAVSDQALSKDGLNRNVLKGELVNQSGRPVNIAQVLAAYYDNFGQSDLGLGWLCGSGADAAGAGAVCRRHSG